MGAEKKPFKISTGLKDLIGRDLITDDSVAVFELVKNAFDAHADQVHLIFEEDKITIIDNGKGMSRDAILDKWLFVAYSAKREGTEDADYRDKIAERGRPYAGAKGVGRFSCDRLGANLRLSSRSQDQDVQIVLVDWRRYEQDAKNEFGKILLDLHSAPGFPDPTVAPEGGIGTVLEISHLRSEWPREKLQALKRDLAKLIDPFSLQAGLFGIHIHAPAEAEADAADEAFNANLKEDQQARQVGSNQYPRLVVNGPVTNPILETLSERTTTISVHISPDGNHIETSLIDRGDLIYKIREKNTYNGLRSATARANIYFLNRKAKMVFARRMGIPSVSFGSIFLFRNGFRVVPIGEQDDDFFGLNQRKQQGQRRFLGGRDLIGRVEIRGTEGFDEATSRNGGLIMNWQVEELINFVRDKCVRRLERYVVDITWKDQFDKDESDTSRIRLDESSALVSRLVSRLAATEGVELIEYNPEIIRIVDEKSASFEQSLGALEILAERTGDEALQQRVVDAKARIDQLRQAEAEAREAERRAEERARTAELKAASASERYSEERKRNDFLVAAASLDQDTILNLHHQIIIHASDVHHSVKRMMARLRNGVSVSENDWMDFLENTSYRNSQILTAAKFATKGGYKQQANESNADITIYMRDYIETLSSLWAPQGLSVKVETDGRPFKRNFKPIEIGIVIDNLVSNAEKANASEILFSLSTSGESGAFLLIEVADDGVGWPTNFENLTDVLEKGVTTTDGSGLGLFHVRRVVEGMRGTVEPMTEPYSEDLEGAHLRLKVPK